VHIGKDEVAASWHAMEDEVAASCCCTWCTAGCICGIAASSCCCTWCTVGCIYGIAASCNLTFPRKLIGGEHTLSLSRRKRNLEVVSPLVKMSAI
jgi:hypothetical protein